MTTADFRIRQAEHDQRNEAALIAYACFVSSVAIAILTSAWWPL